MVENLPAGAWDTGSVPGVGRFRLMQGSQVHAPQLLEATLSCSTREVTTMRGLSSASREQPLLATIREGPCVLVKTQCSQEENENPRVQGSWQVESGERRSLACRILDRIKELEKIQSQSKENEKCN